MTAFDALHPDVSARTVAALVAAMLLCLAPVEGVVAQAIPDYGGASPAAVSTRAATPIGSAATNSLRPGDHVRITVWHAPELSGEFTVGADGRLQHPFYSAIMAVGVTPELLRESLRQQLTTLVQAPEFLVEPLLRVAVGGEVRAPGLYNVAPGTTVADVILMGGGITENGRLEKIAVLRGGQELTVDLRAPDATQALLVVQSGDQLLVATRRSFFRDYVVPASSVVGALGWIATMVFRR